MHVLTALYYDNGRRLCAATLYLEFHAQAFLLLTLLSMMNCAVHQILKISLKIYLLGALSAIYFAVSTLELLHLGSRRLLHDYDSDDDDAVAGVDADAVGRQRYVCSTADVQCKHCECSFCVSTAALPQF